jgi:hypothetical protein
MNLYRVTWYNKQFASSFIKAESEEEALEIAKHSFGEDFEVHSDFGEACNEPSPGVFWDIEDMELADEDVDDGDL